MDASGWSRKELLRQCGDAVGMVIRSRIRIDREFWMLRSRSSSLPVPARAWKIDVPYAEAKVFAAPEFAGRQSGCRW